MQEAGIPTPKFALVQNSVRHFLLLLLSLHYCFTCCDL
jgi:hypothetical protein